MENNLNNLYWGILLGEPSVEGAQAALIKSAAPIIKRAAKKLVNQTQATQGLRRRLIESAEEAAETAVIEAVMNIESAVPKNIAGWLYRVAWRGAVANMQKARREAVTSDAEMEHRPPSARSMMAQLEGNWEWTPEPTGLKTEDNYLFVRLYCCGDDLDRRITELCREYFSNDQKVLTNSEIAELLGVSEKTIYRRWQNITRKFLTLYRGDK